MCHARRNRCMYSHHSIIENVVRDGVLGLAGPRSGAPDALQRESLRLHTNECGGNYRRNNKLVRCGSLAFGGGRSRAVRGVNPTTRTCRIPQFRPLGVALASYMKMLGGDDYGPIEQHERCGSLVNGGEYSRAFGGGHIYLIWCACTREWSVNANSLECVDPKEQGFAPFPQGVKSKASTWSLVARCRGVKSRALGSLVAPSMGVKSRGLEPLVAPSMGVKSKASGSLVASSHVGVSSRGPPGRGSPHAPMYGCSNPRPPFHWSP